VVTPGSEEIASDCPLIFRARTSQYSCQSDVSETDKCAIDTEPETSYPSITPDIELRSLSELRRRGDDGWLQDSPNCCLVDLVDGGINEPRWLFNLEIHRGLGVQVSAFPKNRPPADEERTAAQVGGVHFQAVWLLAMDKDERIELLHKFFRQLLRTATESLDSIDMLKLGIPEEQELARLLWTFDLAFETYKEIHRMVADSHLAADTTAEKDDAPNGPQTATNWPSQDGSFGMR
jgi:hypothetical protein